TNSLHLGPPQNVIRFDTAGAFATATTVELSMAGDTTQGPSALAITGRVEIDGPTADGDGVTVSAAASAPAMRLFYVAAGGELTLQDLTLSGGMAQGAPNGGYGEGGAIYNSGSLTVFDSTVVGNQAIGVGANGLGGALFNDGGDATITDSTFAGNAAVGTGSF